MSKALKQGIWAALLPAAAALALTTGLAEGADLVLDDSLILDEPVAERGGFYYGGHLGALSGAGQVDFNGGGGDWQVSGFAAGVFAGYDWFWGDILWGVEGDLNIAAAGGSGSGGAANIEYNYGTDLFAFGSLRKRLGLVFGPWTIYGTAGVAFAHSNFWSEDCYSTCYAEPDQPLSQFGFTGGAGVQYAINDMVEVRGALNFYSFQPHEVTLGESSDPHAKVNQSFVMASIGVLFHLN